MLPRTHEPSPPRLRVGYLGPEGTFTEAALLAGGGPGDCERVPLGTIYDTVMAVQDGLVDRSLVPMENSIEGSVAVTLDTLAGDATDVAIVGEAVLAVRQCLIAQEHMALEQVTAVISHPQAAGQCARLLRGELAHAMVLGASSTADAVRAMAESRDRTRVALGTRHAAEIYGCVVLREGVEDRSDNQTRFVWLARERAPHAAPFAPAGGPACATSPARPFVAGWRTSLLFWGTGADRPGWLVACLDEFARRSVNLTRIESRPRRDRLGQYMFFVDLDGAVAAGSVSAAIAGLREHCEDVRILGSYPAASG